MRQTAEDRIRIIKTGINLIAQKLPELRTTSGEGVLITYQLHVTVQVPHEIRTGLYLGECHHVFTEEDAEALGFMMQCLSQESNSLFTEPGQRELQARVYALFQKMLGRDPYEKEVPAIVKSNGGDSR